MTRTTGYGRRLSESGPDPLERLLERAETSLGKPVSPQGRMASNPTGSVLVFGLGRLGSWAAFFLARFVGAMRVVDRDSIERHNLATGNCIFREKDIGIAKSQATKAILEEYAPRVRVEAFQADITLMTDAELLSLAEGADVALCLVDEGEALFRVNAVLHGRLPVIYAAGHRGARTGDVLVSRPVGACLRCLLNIDSPVQIQTLHGEATHGIDIVVIAETCAKVALVLLGDSRLGDVRQVLDPAVNFIYLENRRSPTSPRGSAPQYLRIERRRLCPTCGASERR